jgi:hypothetical protein
MNDELNSARAERPSHDWQKDNKDNRDGKNKKVG